MDQNKGFITTESLKRYNAADLDPYTVEVAQSLCERFHLSQIGYRNLSDTFSSLPSIQVFKQNFEVGYGKNHPVPAIIESSSGSVLAGIVGSLSEYFSEDVVVEFFVLLTKRSNVPRAGRPTPEQWRRMVDVFYGILVPSNFGFLLTAIANACPRLVSAPDPERILKALDRMSERTKQKDQQSGAEIIEADSEAVYLTAASTWLFGLNTTINTISNEVIYRSSATEAKASIEIQLMPQRKTLSMQLDGLQLSPRPKVEDEIPSPSITGGRVLFERLLESSFGAAFRSISKDTLSAFICCASNIIQHNHQQQLNKLQSSFLPQAAAKRDIDKHSLKETIFAWFPEIRRLSSRFERYANMTASESKHQFETTTNELRDQCPCGSCTRGTDPYKACQVAIAFCIVKLGLSVSRVVLSPKVYPKQYGIKSLYDQCQAQYTTWQTSGTSIGASEHFVYNTMGILPTTTDLLKTACLLFTTSIPGSELSADTELVGVSHRGFAIFSTMFVDIGDKLDEPSQIQSVKVMPGWMCPFGHEMKLEVYDPGLSALSIAESWDAIASRSKEMQQKELRQILKRRDNVVLSSIVIKGTQLEEQATLHGWLVVDDQLD